MRCRASVWSSPCAILSPGTLQSSVQDMILFPTLQLVPLSTDLSVSFAYRPGVGAPIIGPDGNNGSGMAYAPTPGMGEQTLS